MITDQCYEKWITVSNEMIRNKGAIEQVGLQGQFARALAGKIADRVYRSPKAHGGANIQAILGKADFNDQMERSTAMWYGYCKDNSSGARFMLRLFSAMRAAGILYRKATGQWGDFRTDFGDMPVASLMSHGSRVLFLLPPSNSGARAVGNTAKAIVKGVTVDPLKRFIGTSARPAHTLNPQIQTAMQIPGVGRLGVGGVIGALAAVLSTPAKAIAAGDDRIMDWFTGSHWYGGGAASSRFMATHSTIKADWSDPAKIALARNRYLWFTEEKAGFGSNIGDSMLGRHMYLDVALGGKGNINPFSGVKIDDKGGHGHVYVNYRSPKYCEFGCLLVGCEGSAPGIDDQSGKVHDTKGSKGKWSPTGALKWTEVLPLGGKGTFYDAAAKGVSHGDVTVLVCDLSDRPTSTAMDFIDSNLLAANELHKPLNAVQPADWQATLARFEGHRDKAAETALGRTRK